MNLKELTELNVRIRNLYDILSTTIRYNETDLSRVIRETIRKKERERDVLRGKIYPTNQ
jgi:hypothetical protein